MTDTVLVTGAGGFVGSAVVRALVRSLEANTPPAFADGRVVRHVVAVLRAGGSMERLRELSPSEHWHVEHADLVETRDLQNLLARVSPRTILHLAVHGIRDPDPTPADNQRVILGPLETLFQALRDVTGGRLIHTSSARVLRAGDGPLDETALLQPRNVYGRHKAQADTLLPVFGEKTGVEWINLRLFNVFGKYEHTSQLLPHLVSRLSQGTVAELSSGEQIRDFNDVDDVAQAYLLALQAPATACGHVYHIGSGRGTRVRDFALTVASVTGNAHLIRFGASGVQNVDPYHLVADPGRAERFLRWQPASDLGLRIRSAAEWWQRYLEREAARS